MSAETVAPSFERVVEGFGTVLVLPVDPEADVDLLHSWVTQERARFWGMLDADRERVREIYAHLDSLSTHHAYLVRVDDCPVALFQTYWAEADEVGEAYDAQPGDLGIHLLVGPTTALRAGWTETLALVLAAFVLQDPSVVRVLAEPDARNTRAADRLVRTGFALGPQVDLPHKRAQLAFLDRAALEALLAFAPWERA